MDDGIDLLGHKLSDTGASRTYLFQVKTTQNRITSVQFGSEKFERLLQDAVNLVVVLWAVPESPKAHDGVPTSLCRHYLTCRAGVEGGEVSRPKRTHLRTQSGLCSKWVQQEK